MPTKRRKLAPARVPQVTEEAIACWKAGDFWGLHQALGLKVWQMPDWGFDPPEVDRYPEWPPTHEACMRVCEAQRQLIEIAGPPPRKWFYESRRHADKAP
jgi:hypothetical protein